MEELNNEIVNEETTYEDADYVVIDGEEGEENSSGIADALVKLAWVGVGAGAAYVAGKVFNNPKRIEKREKRRAEKKEKALDRQAKLEAIRKELEEKTKKLSEKTSENKEETMKEEPK